MAFGRAAEVAQLIETEIGTALLALDALETKSFLKPDQDAYVRLREAIDKQTLGRSLKQMGARLKLTEGLDTLFQAALGTRNLLAHRFFPQHGLAMLDAERRKKMVLHLLEMQTELRHAYATAQNISELLVRSVMLLDNAHR